MVAMMAVEVQNVPWVAVGVATQMAAVAIWVVRLVLDLVLDLVRDVVHGRHHVVPLADVVRHRRLTHSMQCAKRF